MYDCVRKSRGVKDTYMIVLDEKRYLTLNPGYITLQDEEGRYYYIHRLFYEQAVIISDRYGTNISALTEQIGGHPEFTAISQFVETAPKPVSIMGYFLALLEEDLEDYDDIVGALDIISTAINMRRFIKQPKEIRQSVSFSLSVKEEYTDIWNMFLTTQCCDYDDFTSAITDRGTPVRKKKSHVEDVDDEDDEDIDDLTEDDVMAMFAEAEAKAYETIEAEKEQESAAEAKTPADGGSGLGVIAKRRRSL